MAACMHNYTEESDYPSNYDAPAPVQTRRSPQAVRCRRSPPRTKTRKFDFPTLEEEEGEIYERYAPRAKKRKDSYESKEQEPRLSSDDETGGRKRSRSGNEIFSPSDSTRQRGIQTWLKSLGPKRTCADCSSRDELEWVVLPWAVLVCRSCASAHRKLRKHTIQNIYQDSIDVDRLQKANNVKRNTNLEKFLQPWRRRPHKDSTTSIRERFIQDKYEKMLFTDTDQAKAFKSECKEVWDLVRFLTKHADPKKPYDDGRAVTETINLLLDYALDDETFKNSFYELLRRMNWDSAWGFKTALRKSEVQKLCNIITDRGWFFGMKTPQNQKEEQQTQPQQQPSETRDYRERKSRVRSNTQVQRTQDYRPKREVYKSDRDSASPSPRPRREVYNGTPAEPEPTVKRRSSVKKPCRYRETAENEFKVKIYGKGLGMGIGSNDRWGGAVVLWVDPGTEAWSCGVRKGDVILEVNYTDITKKRTEYIKELIDEARPLSMRLARNKSYTP